MDTVWAARLSGSRPQDVHKQPPLFNGSKRSLRRSEALCAANPQVRDPRAVNIRKFVLKTLRVQYLVALGSRYLSAMRILAGSNWAAT